MVATSISIHLFATTKGTKDTKDTKIMLTQVGCFTVAEVGGTGCNPVLPEATENCQGKGANW